MYQLNLNLFLTFFWLFLTAFLLLFGIWILIDCQCNISLFNFFIKHFNLSMKLDKQGSIPKSYSYHFYLIGLVINLILFVFHISFVFLFIFVLCHLGRRLYECLYIQQYRSKMTLFEYLFELIHYPCVGLTIIADYQYSYTNLSLCKYLFGVILFVYASYFQYHSHLTLAKLLRNSNEFYPIPNGYWIFEYLTSPNVLLEFVIYFSILIASHRTSAMTSLIVWIFVRQTFTALFNHRWYLRYYRNSYPSKRCALIPFLI